MKIKTCKRCGKKFQTNVHNKKYCDKCRNSKVKCSTCGKYFKVKELWRLEKFWANGEIYCSYKCVNNSLILKEKRRKTYKKKTGYDNPGQNPKVQAKMRKTCQERYNCNYAAQSDKMKIASKKHLKNYME